MVLEDWGDSEVPTDLERHYAEAILNTIAAAPTREFAKEFLARAFAAHRARTLDVARGGERG